MHSWHRTIVCADREHTVSDGFSLGSNTEAIFQIDVRVQPVIDGKTATAGALQLRVISPANAILSALDWTARSGSGETYNSGWRLDITGGVTGYVVELSAPTDVIFTQGFD